MEPLKQLTEKIISGYQLTQQEAMSLVAYTQKDLSYYANELRKACCGEEVERCAIVNGKSGACSEDCTYCAQSAHYATDLGTYGLLTYEAVYQEAKACEEAGVSRFSIVTSGKRLSPDEVVAVANIYQNLHNQTDLSLCASHGLLGEEDFQYLKAQGVSRYHNNLETSRRYFPNICTTHTYEEKINALQAAKKAGLEVCSGGIFGLGENMEDRIAMAFELRDLQVDAIPINILVPIPGTPLAHQGIISEEEVLKSIAIYRMIHPNKPIRLAGGRSALIENGKLALLGGANAMITGDLLTTCGNNMAEDMALIHACGLEVKRDV